MVYIEEDLPLVYHIVRYRPVALIFREGKQSVELGLIGGANTILCVVEKASRQPEDVRQTHPSCPAQYKISLVI